MVHMEWPTDSIWAQSPKAFKSLPVWSTWQFDRQRHEENALASRAKKPNNDRTRSSCCLKPNSMHCQCLHECSGTFLVFLFQFFIFLPFALAVLLLPYLLFFLARYLSCFFYLHFGSKVELPGPLMETRLGGWKTKHSWSAPVTACEGNVVGSTQHPLHCQRHGTIFGVAAVNFIWHHQSLSCQCVTGCGEDQLTAAQFPWLHPAVIDKTKQEGRNESQQSLFEQGRNEQHSNWMCLRPRASTNDYFRQSSFRAPQ